MCSRPTSRGVAPQFTARTAPRASSSPAGTAQSGASAALRRDQTARAGGRDDPGHEQRDAHAPGGDLGFYDSAVAKDAPAKNAAELG